MYPWREIAVGESFKVLPPPEGPTVTSLRNMACQVQRRHPGLKFRVSPHLIRNRWLVTRSA